MADPYACLSEIADNLWDLYQSTTGEASEQARVMYDALQNNYLEPFRRRRIQQTTEQYAQLTADLRTSITAINADIQRINKIADNLQKVAQYAAIFDQITGVAAKLLV